MDDPINNDCLKDIRMRVPPLVRPDLASASGASGEIFGWKCASIPLVDGPNRLAKHARSPQFPHAVNNTKESQESGFGSSSFRPFSSLRKTFIPSGNPLIRRGRFPPPIRGGPSGVYVTKKAMCG